MNTFKINFYGDEFTIVAQTYIKAADEFAAKNGTRIRKCLNKGFNSILACTFNGLSFSVTKVQ